MTRLTTVEIHQDENQFSAGHFTIFSATEREDMHGHNYSVSIAIHAILSDEGLSFDYRVYKKKCQALCEKLDRRFLLPSLSPFLKLEETEDMWIAHFNQERMPFLKRDVVILPISNITIEELSYWFSQELTVMANHRIKEITVKVFNGPGQSGACQVKTSALS